GREPRAPPSTYRRWPMALPPSKKPQPPIWYGLSHLAGAEWAAGNKVHVIANGPPEATQPLFRRYREVWQRTHGGVPMPKLGIGRHVVVGDTDAQAEALARPAYAAWYAQLTKLWRDFGSLPIRFAPDFNEARGRGIAVGGTAGRGRGGAE